jgi:hypothetical protein
MPKRGGSRGRKKPSLRDLPRQMPTDTELARLIEGMDTFDARAAALIMSSMIDNLLEFAIKFNFVDLTEAQFNSLFRNPTAPLTSFAVKIALAHALGVYGDEFKKQLDNATCDSQCLRSHHSADKLRRSASECRMPQSRPLAPDRSPV